MPLTDLYKKIYLLCSHSPGLVRHFWVAAPVADHGQVLARRHRGLHVAVWALGADEGRHVIANVVHQHGVGLEHVPLGVVVDKVQLHVGQEARAVVDLLNCIFNGSRNCSTLRNETILVADYFWT